VFYGITRVVLTPRSLLVLGVGVGESHTNNRGGGGSRLRSLRSRTCSTKKDCESRSRKGDAKNPTKAMEKNDPIGTKSKKKVWSYERKNLKSGVGKVL